MDLLPAAPRRRRSASHEGDDRARGSHGQLRGALDDAAPRIQVLQPARRARRALRDVRGAHRTRGRQGDRQVHVDPARPAIPTRRFASIDADVAAEEVRGNKAALLGGRARRTIRSSRSCAGRYRRRHDRVDDGHRLAPHPQRPVLARLSPANRRRSRSRIRTPASRRRWSGCTGTRSWPRRSACRRPTTTARSEAPGRRI